MIKGSPNLQLLGAQTCPPSNFDSAEWQKAFVLAPEGVMWSIFKRLSSRQLRVLRRLGRTWSLRMTSFGSLSVLFFWVVWGGHSSGSMLLIESGGGIFSCVHHLGKIIKERRRRNMDITEKSHSIGWNHWGIWTGEWIIHPGIIYLAKFSRVQAL